MSSLSSSIQSDFELADAEFHEIRRIVHRVTGIALADSKKHLVHGRLLRRLRVLRINSFTQYLRCIEGDANELEEFCNAITTKLTSFFRENHHFDYLAGTLLPLVQRRNAASKRLRIWSAGCSTGEEPYSIAMTVLESLGHLRDWDIRILATDLDSKALLTASEGSYPADRFEKMPKKRLERWFSKGSEGQHWSASAELKRLITFKRLNLIEQWPVRGPFDVIFCRNVVIYFDKPTQRVLFGRMADLQREGDHLFIGHSESLFNVCPRYELVARTMHRKIH
jgi:chemotaxis protein methyltransferase CheR